MNIILFDDKKIDVNINDFIIKTDQPISNDGGGTAPGPFTLFVASLAACTGYYVSQFLKARKIDKSNVEIQMDYEMNDNTGLITKFIFDFNFSSDFPEKYKKALLRVTRQCTVKKQLREDIEFVINSN